MKFNDYNRKNSTASNPSELVQQYMTHDMNGGSVSTFMQQFDFDTQEELKQSIRDLVYAVVEDKYIGNKSNQDNDAFVRMIARRFSDIACKADKMERYPRGMASELWGSHYSRKNLDMRVAAMFNEEPNAFAFDNACNNLRMIYGLDDHDIEKIRFFVEQVKAGVSFPNSLRRMLYFWGETKKTGKTTCAKMITCILNGETDWEKVDKFSSNLATEMQIGGFKVPRISECNCVMMDECFYADMGKTYADFKRFLTSSNGRARLPYGQEFEWKGMPNYIATSNDSLQKFIKDWDDRRYLSVEFKAEPHFKYDFQQIYAIWWEFVVNSTPVKDWAEWADDMFNYSNEEGERSVYANEFENELRQNEFCDIILGKAWNAGSPTSNTNRVTLKYFVDYFAEHNPDARKRRGEIERAVVAVFGERYAGGSFWIMPTLREVANKQKEENNQSDGIIL